MCVRRSRLGPPILQTRHTDIAISPTAFPPTHCIGGGLESWCWVYAIVYVTVGTTYLVNLPCNLAHLHRSWEAHPAERNSVVKSRQKPNAYLSPVSFVLLAQSQGYHYYQQLRKASGQPAHRIRSSTLPPAACQTSYQEASFWCGFSRPKARVLAFTLPLFAYSPDGRTRRLVQKRSLDQLYTVHSQPRTNLSPTFLPLSSLEITHP